MRFHYKILTELLMCR